MMRSFFDNFGTCMSNSNFPLVCSLFHLERMWRDIHTIGDTVRALSHWLMGEEIANSSNPGKFLCLL